LRWAIGAVLLSAAGSVVNPYGWGLWRFLWQTVGLGRSDITEWQPLYRQPAGFCAWGLGLLVLSVGWWRRRGAPVALFAPAVVLALLSFRVVRLNGFFVLTAVMTVGPLLAGLGPDHFPLSRRPSAGDLVIVGAMALAGMVVVGYHSLRAASCLPVDGGAVMPEAEAVLFARQNQLSGKLLSYFDYGEYAIWHLSPALKVSYDGRRETVYSADVQNRHLRFYAGTDADYATKAGANYVWLPNDQPVAAQLPHLGWRVIFRGARSTFFARWPGQFASVAALSGPRCFPGP
jgi:hypothetical protein